LVERALEVIHKVSLEIVHCVLTEEYTVGHIVQQLADKGDFLLGQEWIIALMLLIPLQFKVVNDDESPRDNETEDI
jgi:hypothetical protein